MTDPQLIIERVDGGRYRIERILAEGARKLVWLAHDARTGQHVAFALFKQDAEVERSWSPLEGEILVRLGEHPNLTRVIDFGREGDAHYLVTEYESGGSLETLLESQRVLEVPAALRIAAEIAAGLEHIHAAGVIHGDVKPANLLLSADGTARLADFGLAVRMDRSAMEATRAILGTLQYAAPERLLGNAAEARTDLYSLGVTLYRMLAGKLPFHAADVLDVTAGHLDAEVPPPSEANPSVPPAVDALVASLLAKRPEDRPASAKALREKLAELKLDEQPAAAARGDNRHPLDSVAPAAFVGREDELRELRSAFADASSGRGRVITLAGDPGIGKTVLTHEFTQYAANAGARILVGRCYEGAGAPSFWPWVQVIRALAEEQPRDEFRVDVGTGAIDIARVVPEVAERLGDLADSPQLEADQARFRFFDSVSRCLQRASERRPLVIVLEDLHWADKSSLLLLSFLACEMKAARLLVVATYRDIEIDSSHPLTDVIASLRREALHGAIQLRGLSEQGVRELMTSLGGQGVPEEFARAITNETEGNPFFIVELLRHLVEERILFKSGDRWVADRAPGGMGIPRSVTGVIERRLQRLGEACRELLSVAAVVGRSFTLEILEKVSEGSEDELLGALDDAIRARVVEPVGRSGETYRFAHALIRETLYEGISITRRGRIHRRVAKAMEERSGAAAGPHLAELAHHYLNAAAAGADLEKTVAYSTQAADSAMRLMAWEDAAALYQRAVDAVDRLPVPDDDLRRRLWLALGEAQIRSGEIAKARGTFLRVANIARKERDAQLLARAALGVAAYFHLRGLGVRTGVVDEELIALLEEALATLPTDDSVLRAEVLGQLALALYYTPQSERRVALTEQAVAMARKLGEPLALADALHARHSATWGPDNVEQRLADTQEIVDLALEAKDRERELLGRSGRCRNLLEKGDIAALESERVARDRIAEELRMPLYRWAIPLQHAGRALMEGRFDEARKLIEESFAIGQRLQAVSAPEAYAAMTATLRRELESLDDLVPLYRALVAGFPGLPAWRCALANVLVLSNRLEEARVEYESLAARDFCELPRDHFWLLGMCLISEVAAALRDPRGSVKLYELIAPFRDLFVVMGSWAGALYGPVSYYLGILATTAGRFEDGARHLQAAAAAANRLGARPWQARAETAHAKLLAQRGAPGDLEYALDLLNHALATAQTLGMKVLLRVALELKLEMFGIRSSDSSMSIHAVALMLHGDPNRIQSRSSPDGTVTLMFSDVVGFTKMIERMGDLCARDVIEFHHRIVRYAAEKHGGYEVELLGDGFLLAFSSARRACHCAIAIHRELDRYNDVHTEEPIRTRIGLHTGEVIHDGDKFFGKVVVEAYRISDRAATQEILVSGVLKQLVESAGDLRFGAERQVELKGLEGLHSVFPLLAS